MSVFRIYVEKMPQYAVEARHLLSDIRTLLQMPALTGLRLLNRYDIEGVDAATFEACRQTVFSEPQLDVTYDDLPETDAAVFATEYLPGQFDQRADSCAQCVQIVSQGERPTVRSAKVYLLEGDLTDDDIAAIKKYLINPVESREASLEKPETLATPFEIPTTVETLHGFLSFDEEQRKAFLAQYGLAMDLDDLKFCQDYFKTEQRDPTITEIRMIDTYWSDHCRHTTFLTVIDDVTFENPDAQRAFERYLAIRKSLGRTRPITLMDVATIGAKYLKSTGKLANLDESDEINACSIVIDVDVDGKPQKWLLQFKNETHNHPTEIEPFGGAATCIGGAIRDPLSGRSYVYQAMRVTGAADPLLPVDQTMPGKLPQTAANGYSSYGNQIGLATGLVDEIYHPGYAAKRLEIGAVVGATPLDHVRRETPAAGDVVLLLGGRTGRDGCGGATGSSKSHVLSSLETCGAEVQKGNAPEERKLQRLFRDPEVTLKIKRCNDFGAGGVSVAIGELADGLRIDLNAVRKKYEGLDGTELAISESQERMAVVVAPEDVDAMIRLAAAENLEVTPVAVVTESPRLVMTWNGVEIVNLSRTFLNSNGAEKHVRAAVAAAKPYTRQIAGDDFAARMRALVTDLNVCSKRGLSERFDSTIGAGSVLMPFGGKYQLTPTQCMAAKIPLTEGETKTCSVMAYGYQPYLTEASPYHGAYLAVVESVCRLVAAGAPYRDAYLTFQEYFERLSDQPQRWGKPLSALLGALDAQLDLGLAAIGGKDSMSGSFENLDVPPTLVSFAIAPANTDRVLSNEWKAAGSRVVLLAPRYRENGLPDVESLKANFDTVAALMAQGGVRSAYVPGYGGVAEALFKMAIGNGIGFKKADAFPEEKLFAALHGCFVLELADASLLPEAETVGETIAAREFCGLSLDELLRAYEQKLEPVFPVQIHEETKPPRTYAFSAEKRVAPAVSVSSPRVLIPVFPGTNCEYDTARAFARAGAKPEIFVVKNLTPGDVSASIAEMERRISNAQIIAIPGGFSGGDEPDGSGKFITAFFRNPRIRDAVHTLLKQRDGLMCGICNGFQALVKLGLVPFGEIVETDVNCPTLTFNAIARHQSSIVRTRVSSNLSPWLQYSNVGDIHTVAISHGEGRFVASEEMLQTLAKNGQIATQYVDLNGAVSMDVRANPNTSIDAIEGITSPDGRVFGKMGHSERFSDNVYKNVDGVKDNQMFRGAVDYFRL